MPRKTKSTIAPMSFSKHVALVMASGLLMLSPMLSLLVFILSPADPVKDAICFCTFGLTCYTLAHFQAWVKRS